MLAALLSMVVVAPQGPVEVELAPKAGDPVVARWPVESFTMATDFGRATIRTETLEQITFGDPDVVVAAGVELRGNLGPALLAVEVAGEPRAFRCADLLTLVVRRGGAAVALPSFGGEWMSSVGPMELTQSGAKVTGTYGWGGSGSITGNVTGRKLAFEYEQGRDSGSGTFELNGGDVLLGQKAKDRFWGAYRKVPVRAAAEPGATTSGQTELGVRYHVHWPADYEPGRKRAAICILHGSNMSSRAYVDTIVSAWPDLAKDYLVVGLDGERMSPASKPDALRFNYTYVNFGGPGVGPIWAQKQSPALVAGALGELGDQLGVDRWFLGGHSQGGFLTYCLVMFYPELLAGAFPMSCNLLVQCEPDNFPAGRQKEQHEVAIAMIHGQADDVVKYSAGEYCESRIMDGGFPFARLFAPKNVGHQFALLPVDDAVRWLDGVSSPSPEKLTEFAGERAAAGAWRDVGALLARRNGRHPDSSDGLVDESLPVELAAATAKVMERLQARMDSDRSGQGKWIEDFLAFRREFGTAPAAAPILERYNKLRAEQQEAADRLFAKSRKAGNKSDRLVIYEQIQKQCWATKWYEAVKLWSR